MIDPASRGRAAAMMLGMARTAFVAIVSSVAALACSRNEAPSESVRTPATVSSQAPPQSAAPGERVGSTRTNVADMDLATAEKALADASKELGDAMALAVPDCAALRPLRDRICELSDHICRLPGPDPEIKARCEDGKRRCSDAKDRVGLQCP